MILKSSKFLEILKEKDYKKIFEHIDSTCNRDSYEYSIKASLNSILFIDDNIALEYLIAEHKKVFIEYLDYLQDKAMNVYFSDKCLDTLQNLDKREDLLI